MDSKLKEQLAMADIQIFLEVYDIRNEQGHPIDFRDHPYLFDIFCDKTPHQAIRKAAQVGFSTTAIIKSLWLAKAQKMDLIYTLPTYSDVHDFVSSKVNRIIDQNPVFKQWTSDKDTIEQKRVGDSVIYYRGTFSERAALMVSSDLNVHDEVDRSNLKVVDQYYSRLQHSKYGWQWLFSNPSAPDTGVDRLWNRSDQKHWFVPCPKCNHEQFLTMANVFDKDETKKENKEYYFGCVKCRTELNRRKGRWIKRWKDITGISGYWISLLMCPWVTASKIKLLERTKRAEYFDNFVLGVPHTGSGNVVSKDVIMRNLTNEINRQDGRIVIGVDPGVDIRYVVGNEKGLFYYGSCKNYNELDQLMSRWDKAIMVMDQGGDIIGSRLLRDKYKNRVFLAAYRTDKKDDKLFSWKDVEGTVSIDRNNTIQLLIDELTDRRLPIYGTETDWYDYWVHWSHIYRVVEEDSFGRPRYKWQRSDRDDWCFVAGTKVMTKKGEKNIEDIKVGETVLTRNGYRKVYKSGISNKSAKVIRATFSNGKQLIATPNHKIWIKGKGWTRLDSIVNGDKIIVCKQKQLYSMESNLEDTQKQNKEHIDVTLAQLQIIGKKELVHYIKKFGGFIMDKSQKVQQFTIKMVILLIIRLLTLSVFKEEVINHFTIKNGLKLRVIRGSLVNTLVKLGHYLTNGQKLKKVSTGLKDTLMNQSFLKSQENSNVSNVEEMEKQEVEQEENFVAEDVSVIGIQEIGERHTVYNLSVEDQHEYFANGILVSNCHATVYWRCGIDRFMQGAGAIIDIQNTFGENGLTVSADGRHIITRKQEY